MLTQTFLLVTSMLSTVFSVEYPVVLDLYNVSPPETVQQNAPRRYAASSLCPNYPYCHQDVAGHVEPVHLVPPVSLTASDYQNRMGSSLCSNHPFCDDSPPDFTRQVSPVQNVPPAPLLLLTASAYSTGVDPSRCPNYPFCNTISYAPGVPADVDSELVHFTRSVKTSLIIKNCNKYF
nr:uncharacterized protein LOC106680888 [Halyomorpha halys]